MSDSASFARTFLTIACALTLAGALALGNGSAAFAQAAPQARPAAAAPAAGGAAQAQAAGQAAAAPGNGNAAAPANAPTPVSTPQTLPSAAGANAAAAEANAAEQESRALGRALETISSDGRPMSLSLQILLLMSLLTVLPSILLMMTSFTRIIIVLSILRQALGLQQTPPNQVLVGLALFLSLFVMRPVIDEVNATAYTPYGQGQISIEEAVSRSGTVLHGFMVHQTRQKDLRLFSDLAGVRAFAQPSEIPFSILLPAFVTSELKTAFMIGFLIFLPFLVIDLVVSSTLMSLGMMMLSPSIVSMPFKLLLFVLVDGWALTMGSLAASFGG